MLLKDYDRAEDDDGKEESRKKAGQTEHNGKKLFRNISLWTLPSLGICAVLSGSRLKKKTR